jgi:hypothetical protein
LEGWLESFVAVAAVAATSSSATASSSQGDLLVNCPAQDRIDGFLLEDETRLDLRKMRLQGMLLGLQQMALDEACREWSLLFFRLQRETTEIYS